MKVYIAQKSEELLGGNDFANLGVFETEEQALECIRTQCDMDIADLKTTKWYHDVEFNKFEYPKEDGTTLLSLSEIDDGREISVPSVEVSYYVSEMEFGEASHFSILPGIDWDGSYDRAHEEDEDDDED